MNDAAELSRLQGENARLIALLESHGIDWRAPQPVVLVAQEPEPSRLSTAEKVALFRRLFRGRTDVYPVRWESKTSGKSGYAPACANEWRAGVCEKPRIKCGDCSNRLLIPLSDAVIYDHLAGDLPFLKSPAYGASKAGVVNMTKYFSTLWGPSGVRVNTLSPGGVLGGQDEQFKAKYGSRVPLGRMAVPDDLTGPLVFLATAASSYVTGHELRVDGGFTAW